MLWARRGRKESAMPKTQLEPFTFLLPVPAVLVTTRDRAGRANVLTVSWIGIACSDPPMLSLGIRPSRHSHGVIQETGELVVNIPRAERVREVDLCGGSSGRDTDKLAAVGLTPLAASKVGAPLLAECPINLECKVRHVLQLGAHDLFVVEVIAAHADSAAVDESGRVRLEAVNPLAYCPADNSYVALGAVLGTYGLARTPDADDA